MPTIAIPTVREASRLARSRGLPLVFGHRGAMANAPENTLPAFRLAWEQGADGIELDVHMSADGRLVVIHDATVDATTNGSGRVDCLEYDAIRRLDAGLWFAPAFAGTRVPLLEEVFEAFGASMLINIELKSGERGGIAGRDPLDRLVKGVVAAIRAAGLSERVIVSSSSSTALDRLCELAPEIATGFLWAPEEDGVLRSRSQDRLRFASYLEWRSVSPATIAAEHAAGRQVNVWTVNDLAAAARLAAWGVDGIITNEPAAVIAAIYRNLR